MLLPVVKTITALGFTTWVLLAVAEPHDPPLLVSVSVAVPLKPAGGDQVAFKVVAFGLKVPPDAVDHVPPVADPPTMPPRGEEVPPWHIAASAGPALAVGNTLTVIVPPNEACVHVPVVVTV